MKRKAETDATNDHESPTKALKPNGSHESDFHEGLLDETTSDKYRDSYAASGPYRHAVIQPLISDSLLRSVRQEIVDNIHFTAKETDIYRIFQSGDLANLDGLPEEALSKLPSLLRLRDALYSPEFRAWISKVSDAGPVSGQKTDMAINVYKPGCHLLCHDDVIGSRRVSYILYLTDPDTPWKAEWGGALRLYPTHLALLKDHRQVRVPNVLWSKVIPPAWNQLSFFAVQPGESFHDVEEVFHPAGGSEKGDERVRMAISGWFHIPQEGEDGYEEGLEEKLAEQSSLQQLQAKHDELEKPKITYSDPQPLPDQLDTSDDGDLTQEDLDFLLQFISPQYLTPDTVDELSTLFADESSLQLANLLSPKLLDPLRAQLQARESAATHTEDWATATPPHKHRFLYRHPSPPLSPPVSADVLLAVLSKLLPSAPFHKWLSLVTGLTLGQGATLARRFRSGMDYSLATAHDDDLVLEYTLNLTPSEGWDRDDAGGYEMYMAADEEEDGETEEATTGGGRRRLAKLDPAVYRAQEEEDGGVLFSAAPQWNVLNVVLRDKGTLRFVKYVSRQANGDRWDCVGSKVVLGYADDDEEDDEEDGEDGEGDEEEGDEEEDAD